MIWIRIAPPRNCLEREGPSRSSLVGPQSCAFQAEGRSRITQQSNKVNIPQAASGLWHLRPLHIFRPDMALGPWYRSQGMSKAILSLIFVRRTSDIMIQHIQSISRSICPYVVDIFSVLVEFSYRNRNNKLITSQTATRQPGCAGA